MLPLTMLPVGWEGPAMEDAGSPAMAAAVPIGVVATVGDDDHEQDQESRQSAQLDAEAEAGRPQLKLLHLLLSRIKGLIKADPEVTLVSQEAVFAIGKATERFVEVIAKDASKTPNYPAEGLE